MESQLQDAVTGDKPGDYLRDPYPYFARKRSEGGVFHGTVMDYPRPRVAATQAVLRGGVLRRGEQGVS